MTMSKQTHFPFPFSSFTQSTTPLTVAVTEPIEMRPIDTLPLASSIPLPSAAASPATSSAGTYTPHSYKNTCMHMTQKKAVLS